MKKTLCILLSLLLLLSLAACKGNTDINNDESTDSSNVSTSNSQNQNTTEETNKPSDTAPSASQAPAKADLASIKNEILSSLKIEDSMDISTERLTELYGIEQNDVASSACFITVAGSFPEEAIMLEASSKEAQSRIDSLLNSRLDDIKVQSESYDEENYALAQSCKVISQGNYIALFISASHSEMENIFLAAVK